MRAALSEARKSIGLTSPNPAVGAVLTIDNRIVARARHRQAGSPHAEVECLRSFSRRVPQDATLYVTLEPCSTIGRTAACTEQILKSNLKTVVVGAIDPNPRHAGRGIELLRKAGIEVRVGILADECSSLNEAFNKWIVTGLPFVVAKCGMSLDGRLTRSPREARWITGEHARKHARELRGRVDAILIGAETLRKDDPHLTVRGIRNIRQPLRVVMTRSGKLPPTARLFRDRFADRTLVYRRRSLGFVLRDLGKRNITSVLIEGGGDILGQALDARAIDKIQIYLGPIITGGPTIAFGGRGADLTSHAVQLRPVQYEKLGQDVCVVGYPEYPVRSEPE
jgi:diaminohydroxyphosphoribosylaminopyrimidine deaminase/5-amino-6-(5-phosphoribosylamino)uracil reductase